jgi:ATP-binding cassette subfamily B multidrug efflux pump
VNEDEVLGKAYDARLMRRLLTYLRPYWREVAVALAAIIAGAAAQLAQPYLVKLAIDRFIAVRRLDGLGWLAAAYLAILIAAFALEYLQTWTMQMTGQRIMFDLRMAIYGHLQRIDLRYYDRNPVGRLMTRVTSDVDVLNDLFTSGVVTIFGDVFTLVGIMAVMLAMNWRLALVAFAVLPLIVLVAQWFRGHVRDSYRIVRGWIARINAFLNENITGMTTVQLFRREGLNFSRFDEIDRKHRDANFESIFYYSVFYPAIEIVAALASALIIWYGGASVLGRTLTIGALVAFLQYSQRFFRPISDMSEKFNVLQAAMASSERIFALLDEPIAVRSPAAPVHRRVAAGHIAFEGVWFAYNQRGAGAPGVDDADYVLRDVSFEVKPGQRVGIVGATGAGKSTITNLLLRFYDVNRGRITVDGVDIRELDLAELRGMISLVLQDVHLFSGTIADNIRYGRLQATMGEIVEAARAANAHDFIERLADGYETDTGERGVRLSGGERQRICVARAFLKDAPILILDEPTSSIDSKTEAIILDALDELMIGRTTFMIAHRLSTIRHADLIATLDRGGLVEQGTHDELIARGGLYKEMHDVQTRQRKKKPALSLMSGPGEATA